jgi:hypothetical protein
MIVAPNRVIGTALSSETMSRHGIKRQPPFDSTSFLAQAGEGRSIDMYRKGRVVFSQGDVGDAVFYVQESHSERSSGTFAKTAPLDALRLCELKLEGR